RRRRQGGEGQGVKPPVPGDKRLPTPDPAQVQVIRTYGPGRFLIGEREWKEPVLVTATATTAWNALSIEELSPALLKDAPQVEVLVVGCGARAAFLPPARRAAFKQAGVGLEVVD